MTTPNEKPKCIVPECKRKGNPKQRGLCAKCYAFARGEVKAGRTTWEALEVAGKVLSPPPRKPRARKDATKEARDWFKTP